MKKLLIALGSFFLLCVMLVLGAGFYIKNNLGEITRKMSGMEITFADVDVSYTPMPTIVLTDLAFQDGENSVNVPTLKLYPDFSKIFSGQISLRKAVLDDPLVVAQDLGGTPAAVPESTAPAVRKPLNMNAIPTGLVVVNRGKLMLEKKGDGAMLPLLVTAQAEKVDQVLAVQVTNASIDEIGLKFAGEVNIESFAPLRVRVNASEGNFNPRAVKEFLLKFGYITEELAGTIPAIESVGSQGIQLAFDADSGNVDLDAESVNIDRLNFHKIGVKLSDGGVAVRFAEGVVDVGSLFGWMRQNPDGKKALDEMLASAKLQDLTARGEIRLSSLQLLGTPQEGGDDNETAPMNVDGALQAKVQGLVLHLKAENGEEQDLTIGELDSTITIKQGKPTVQVKKLTFESSRGGSGSITGTIAVPLDLKRISLQSSIDSFQVFDTTLDLRVNKSELPKATFDLKLVSPSRKVYADGIVYIPGRRQTDLEARLNNLRISGPPPEAQPPPSPAETNAETSLDEPFDFSAIQDMQVSAQAFIKRFQFGDLTRLEDVDLLLESANEKAMLNGTVRLAGIDLVLGAVVFPPSKLVTTVETKGTDVDLTSLIACFSKELPVFLTGRLYMSGSFATQGETIRSLIDAAEGEVTVSVTEAAVQRLSGLDTRLGFILDILRAARISAEERDSISFNRGAISANLAAGRVELSNFSLVGPLLSAWGSGEFTMKEKHLKLTGGVKTPVGVTAGLDIDRILEKRET